MYRMWLNISISIIFSGIKSANHTNTAMVTVTTKRLISSKQFSLYTFITNLPTKYSNARTPQGIAIKTIRLSNVLTISDAIDCSILSMILPTFSDKSTIFRNPFTHKFFTAITAPAQSATTRSD